LSSKRLRELNSKSFYIEIFDTGELQPDNRQIHRIRSDLGFHRPSAAQNIGLPPFDIQFREQRLPPADIDAHVILLQLRGMGPRETRDLSVHQGR